MATLPRLAACATLLAAAAPLPAAAPPPRAATTPWVLDFGESQCLASRDYGTPADPLTLALKPSPYGDLMELVLLRKGSGSTLATEVPATIRIDERPPIAATALVYRVRKDGPRLARARLPSGASSDLRGARTLVFTARGEGEVSLAMGGTRSLMDEMDRCLASLQDHWNISEARRAALRSSTKGSLQGVFKSEDYPSEAVSGNSQGTSGVALLIDQSGKVADCTLTQTSGYPILDLQSCAKITQRARYTPAVGADGKPARHAAVGRITWRLPGGSNSKPQRSRSRSAW